jgi:hypothetical protein
LDVREIWLDVMDWNDLAQDRDQWRAVVNTVMNLWVPWNVGKFLSSLATGGFLRKTQLYFNNNNNNNNNLRNFLIMLQLQGCCRHRENENMPLLAVFSPHFWHLDLVQRRILTRILVEWSQRFM